MKLKIFVAALAVVIAWFAGHHFYRAGQLFAGTDSGGAPTLAERIAEGEQMVNDSYALAAGARVEVSGINGPVEIVTTEGNVAEIHVENRTGDVRDLERHKIAIEHGADFLAVRAENRSGGWGFLRWLVGRGGGGQSAHQRVVLKVPRRVEVAARGINGEVRIGEVEGAVHISGVNGAVTVGRAAGDAQFSGVNGNVTFGVSNPADEGVRVSGVNGDIVMRLAQDTNADVRLSGFHGEVDYDLRDVTVEDAARSHWKARIGAGGPLIRMSGIHGNIHFAGV